MAFIYDACCVSVHTQKCHGSLYYILFEGTFYSALADTSHPHLEALAMQPSVSYIMYATSYHEKTGNIITFAQFEEGGLVQNKNSGEEEELFLTSIDELCTEDGSDDGSIITNQWWACAAPASLKVLFVSTGNNHTGASQYSVI